MVAKGASGVWPLPLLSPALEWVDWTKKTLLGAKRASLKTSGPTPPSVRDCRKGERVLGMGRVSSIGSRARLPGWPGLSLRSPGAARLRAERVQPAAAAHR